MKKRYQSTRNEDVLATSSEAILTGMSPDGGLFVLKDIPRYMTSSEKLMDKNYQQLAIDVLTLFLEDFTLEQIEYCVNKAYTDTFSDEKVTPLKKVGEHYILELFHGPTSAFKDIALALLPRLMETSLTIQKRSETLLILTATSGDTGKAALEGFKDNPLVKLIVFYPDQGVSNIQKLQMETQEGLNVRVTAIDGHFDDAQTAVKTLFNDEDLKQHLNQVGIQLSSANSINIGRLIPQIVYYLDAYRQLLVNHDIQVDELVDFIVPTGNFGDILAGYYAKQLGLPIRKLVCASNQNHVLTDFLSTGCYDSRRQFYKTSSPSMDILISSNLERLLFYASGQDEPYVKKCMETLATTGQFTVNQKVLTNIQQDFACGYVTDQEVLETIGEVYKEHHYLLDPHTAVAYRVMKERGDESVKQVVLATASPYKFLETVAKGIQMENPAEDPFKLMLQLEEKTNTQAPSSLKELQEKSVRFSDCLDKAYIKDYVVQQVKELTK